MSHREHRPSRRAHPVIRWILRAIFFLFAVLALALFAVTSAADDVHVRQLPAGHPTLVGEEELQSTRDAAARGEAEAALAAVRRALHADPENAEILWACTEIANWNGAYDEAIACWDDLLARRDLDVGERRRASLGRARSTSWSGDADAAVALYRRHVERYPDDAEARLELARAEGWRGNTPAALDVLDAYVRDFGDCPECRRELAFVLARSEPRAALELLGELLPARPDDAFLRGVEPVALARGGRPRAALESLERLRATAPAEERTEDVVRLVETPLRSRLAPSFELYDDSDSIRREAVALGGTWAATPGLHLDAGVHEGFYAADLGSGLEATAGRDLHTRGLHLALRGRVAPSLAVEGRVGWTEIEETTLGAATGDDELFTYALGLDLAFGDHADLRLEHERDLFDVSPRTLDLGIHRDATRLALAARPDPRWTLDVGAVHSDLSDGNQALDLSFAPRRIVLRRQHWNLDLGLRGRWLSWDRREASGYYAPEDYRRYDLTAFAYWKLSDQRGLSLALGVGPFRDETMDEYELAGDVSVELTLGIFSDWMFRLRGAYSENDRLATGAFDAVSAAVELSRRF